MDGYSVCTIQTLEDMLRACVIDFMYSWDVHLPLIEFAYNNNYHSNIMMAPNEALYGRRCRSPVSWFEVGEEALIEPDSVHDAMERVQLIRERLKTAQSHQKSYANKGVLRFGMKGKLSPGYVGPSNILKRIGKVAYELELPAELAAVHLVFHILLLKKCVGDPASIVPLESLAVKDSPLMKRKSHDPVNHSRVHGPLEGPRSVEPPLDSAPSQQSHSPSGLNVKLREPSRAVALTTDHGGVRGSQLESTRARSQTTVPFMGRGLDDGPRWCPWKPSQKQACRSIHRVAESSLVLTKLVLSMGWPAGTFSELKVH
ncbi:hypothetical protein MTR67_039219 [Solanum verrucosum]|uniref:Tf2-1-like SH3-like domain-containing protein n=1 Tax=Solanum verrucosum TaxID=315347 RepID=A0AAF0UH97_SOLVR|nr:hypothetical protein MTR67_039219 [Solanum verrucosum]